MDYFTTKEIGEKLGKTEYTIRKMCREGIFIVGDKNIAIKLGRDWKIHKTGYEEWEKIQMEKKAKKK